MKNRNNKRIEGLDILRGLFAFSIMLDHYAHWSSVVFPHFVDLYLRKMSFIGVDGFFILSGFVMFVSYDSSGLPKKDDAIKFYVKRWLRIAPLFYLVALLNNLLQVGSNAPGNWLTSIMILGIIVLICMPGTILRFRPNAKYLNWVLIVGLVLFVIGFFFLSKHKLGVIAMATFLYGFINPADSMGGGWSIGNEFVFYYFFPFMLLFVRSLRGASIMLVISIVVAVVFAEVFHPDAWNSGHNWAIYTQFWYHAECFFIGIFLAHVFRAYPDLSKQYLSLALLCLLGGGVALVLYANPSIGIGRSGFLLAMSGIVFIMAYLPIPIRAINRLLLGLGDISYTIFLMTFPLKNIFGLLQFGWAGFIANILVVMLVGILVYHLYEYTLIQFARSPRLKLSKRGASMVEADLVMAKG